MKLNGAVCLGWRWRVLLALVAFGGSTVYALSFANVPERVRWLPVATAIGIAAGVSWVLFGLVLLVVTRWRPSVWHWADACLRTMACGMAVKMSAVVANLVGVPSAWFHLGVLLVANLVMAAVFVWQARRLGMRLGTGLGLWFGALNGVFALVLGGLLNGGGR